jgi:hypothetical protein
LKTKKLAVFVTNETLAFKPVWFNLTVAEPRQMARTDFTQKRPQGNDTEAFPETPDKTGNESDQLVTEQRRPGN